MLRKQRLKQTCVLILSNREYISPSPLFSLVIFLLHRQPSFMPRAIFISAKFFLKTSVSMAPLNEPQLLPTNPQQLFWLLFIIRLSKRCCVRQMSSRKFRWFYWDMVNAVVWVSILKGSKVNALLIIISSSYRGLNKKNRCEKMGFVRFHIITVSHLIVLMSRRHYHIFVFYQILWSDRLIISRTNSEDIQTSWVWWWWNREETGKTVWRELAGD